MRRCPIMNRSRGFLLLGELKNCARKPAHHLAIEGDKVRRPDAVEDRDNSSKRVFGWLSQRFRLLNKQPCLLDGGFCFGCRIAFGVHNSVRKCDLERDLFAAEGRRGR